MQWPSGYRVKQSKFGRSRPSAESFLVLPAGFEPAPQLSSWCVTARVCKPSLGTGPSGVGSGGRTLRFGKLAHRPPDSAFKEVRKPRPSAESRCRIRTGNLWVLNPVSFQVAPSL